MRRREIQISDPDSGRTFTVAISPHDRMVEVTEFNPTGFEPFMCECAELDDAVEAIGEFVMKFFDPAAAAHRYEGRRMLIAGVPRCFVYRISGDPFGDLRDCLPARHDLRNHSPDGFEWGYGGSGPSQLALALLADVLGDEDAQRLYQVFKADVVASMPSSGWNITAVEVREWAESPGPRKWEPDGRRGHAGARILPREARAPASVT